MHPDDWQVPLELMPYLQWFAAVCDDEPAPAIVDASPDALEVFPAPSPFEDSRNESDYIDWLVQQHEAASGRGICPHCGSQGCPHCADTDELEVLPPNDFDSWADLIDSPIVTERPARNAAELARLQFNVEYTRARAAYEPHWRTAYADALKAQSEYLAATE